ncbi:MAG: hypothetical protein AAF928_18590 [Myxococcota bacterium]
MAATLESKGDIESICQAGALTAGSSAELVFRSWDDVSPPFTLKIRDPSGKTVVDRVLRELPTGRPQSAPPITFTVSVAGPYRILIKELYGRASGEATLNVT